MKKLKKPVRLFLLLCGAVCALVLLNALLQLGVAHRNDPFRPDYPRLELRPVLESGALSAADYEDIFLQTGLSAQAVSDFLQRGDPGVELILAAQDALFNPPKAVCKTLIPTTMEERLYDENGALTTGAPLAPLRDGDILVSFSTHTAGWRHGHAGLVVDAARGITLEAPALGSNSSYYDAAHWNAYSSYMVLRVRDLTDDQRRQLLTFAIEHMNDIPYRLTTGLFGGKAIDPAGELAAHCAYLPWYAYMQIGLDLDGTGGRLVTVWDLQKSPLVEIIQVYGLNPADYR